MITRIKLPTRRIKSCLVQVVNGRKTVSMRLDGYGEVVVRRLGGYFGSAEVEYLSGRVICCGFAIYLTKFGGDDMIIISSLIQLLPS